jgi:hypothetical protein
VGVLVLGGERAEEEEEEEARPRVGIEGTLIFTEGIEAVSRTGITGLTDTAAAMGVIIGSDKLTPLLDVDGIEETKATGADSKFATGTGVWEGETLLETAAELVSLFCSLRAS